MRFKFDHDFHIHSYLSLCSGNPEQNAERILLYAKENGLNTLCLTDHFWDERVEGASGWYKLQNREHIKEILPLPQSETVKFHFGAETDMDMHGTIGVTKKTFEELDFVIIPTTHLHMEGFTISSEDSQSVERRAELWISRLDDLLSRDLDFSRVGIAHLACSLIAKSRPDYFAILEKLQTAELERIFTKCAALGVGIELNQSDMSFSDADAEPILRIFKIAKACGCKFYCGSDAHNPDYFKTTKEVFERAIDLLELTENDKFILEA